MTAGHSVMRNRSVPVDADTAFHLITDVERASVWLPDGVQIDLPAPNLLRMWLRDERGESEVLRRVSVDWERLRIDWGSPETVSYAGSLTVIAISTERSTVCLNLRGRGVRALAHAGVLAETALERLADATRRFDRNNSCWTCP